MGGSCAGVVQWYILESHIVHSDSSWPWSSQSSLSLLRILSVLRSFHLTVNTDIFSQTEKFCWVLCLWGTNKIFSYNVENVDKQWQICVIMWWMWLKKISSLQWTLEYLWLIETKHLTNSWFNLAGFITSYQYQYFNIYPHWDVVVLWLHWVGGDWSTLFSNSILSLFSDSWSLQHETSVLEITNIEKYFNNKVSKCWSKNIEFLCPWQWMSTG